MNNNMDYEDMSMTNAGASLLAKDDANQVATKMDYIVLSNMQVGQNADVTNMNLADIQDVQQVKINNISHNGQSVETDGRITNEKFATPYSVNVMGLAGRPENDDDPTHDTLIAVAVSSNPFVIPAKTNVEFDLWVGLILTYKYSNNVKAEIKPADTVSYSDLDKYATKNYVQDSINNLNKVVLYNQNSDKITFSKSSGFAFLMDNGKNITVNIKQGHKYHVSGIFNSNNNLVVVSYKTEYNGYVHPLVFDDPENNTNDYAVTFDTNLSNTSNNDSVINLYFSAIRDASISFQTTRPASSVSNLEIDEVNVPLSKQINSASSNTADQSALDSLSNEVHSSYATKADLSNYSSEHSLNSSLITGYINYDSSTTDSIATAFASNSSAISNLGMALTDNDDVATDIDEALDNPNGLIKGQITDNSKATASLAETTNNYESQFASEISENSSSIDSISSQVSNTANNIGIVYDDGNNNGETIDVNDVTSVPNNKLFHITNAKHLPNGATNCIFIQYNLTSKESRKNDATVLQKAFWSGLGQTYVAIRVNYGGNISESEWLVLHSTFHLNS